MFNKNVLILMFIFLISVISVNSALTDNILAYYSLDEADVSGSIAIDKVGNYNLTCSMDSNCDTTTGKILNASDFDKTNDYMSRAGIMALDTDFSMCAWNNLTSVTGSQAMGEEFTASYFKQNFLVRMSGSSLQVFKRTLNGSSDADQVDTTGINASQWFHWCFTYNSSIGITGDDYDAGAMNLYLNGVLKDNTVTDNNLAIGGSGNFQIGRSILSNHLLGGKQDEIGLWNRTLTQSDITELYNSGDGFAYPFTTPSNFTPQNASIGHFELEVNETVFNSATYVLVLNSTFNFTSVTNLSIRGDGQVSKPISAGTTTLYSRIRINGNTIIDESVRSVTGTGDRGAFNIPFAKVEAVNGVNNITIEFREDGAGSVNVSHFHLDVLSDNADNGDKITLLNETFDGTFSTTSYAQLTNFSLSKTGTGYSLIDVAHKFSTSGSDTTPSCYLQNNNTLEITPNYSRWLETNTDTGSSGISFITENQTSNDETWILYCKSTDTDTITNNVTINLVNLVDDSNHTIQGFQNSSSNVAVLTGSTKVGSYANHQIKNGTGIGLITTFVFQSTSGEQSGVNSPRFILNSSTVTCEDSLRRSLSSNSDVGTVKLYSHCHNVSSGENHTFSAYVEVGSGENLTVLNVSITGMEVYDIPITIVNLAPIVSLDTLTLPNASVLNFGALNIEFANGSYTVSSTVSDPNENLDTRLFTITNSTGDIIYSNTSASLVLPSSLFVDFNNPFNFTLFANDTNGLSSNVSYLINFNDTTNPVCAFASDSGRIGVNYTFDVLCTDSNFYALNVTCDHPYTFYVDGLNTPSYTFNGQFLLQNTTTCTALYWDGHTKKYIPPFDIINKGISEKQINKAVKIKVENPDLVSFELDKKIDRYNFLVNLSSNTDHYVFTIQGKDKVVYLENSNYNGHFVVDTKYWIDFENPYFYDINVTQLEVNKVRVDVELINNQNSVVFESIGLLNNGSSSFVITANNIRDEPLLDIGCPYNQSQSFILGYMGLMALMFALWYVNETKVQIPFVALGVSAGMFFWSVPWYNCSSYLGLPFTLFAGFLAVFEMMRLAKGKVFF